MATEHRAGIDQAIILAGGAGTRLRPLISDVPKPLASVCGRPFIEYLVAQLAAAGVRKATLLTGHMADALEATLGSRSHGVHLEYSVESKPLGTGGALKNAETLLDGDRWLLLNGDSLFDISLLGLAANHPSDASVTVALAEVSDVGRYGAVTTDDDGTVTAFEEKSESGGMGWINAGVYVVSRAALAAIASDRAVSFEREILPALIGRGLRAQRLRGFFIDIGVPDDYWRAQRECGVFERLASATP
jgi:NDP-sugar pyrophosphorylase family protein